MPGRQTLKVDDLDELAVLALDRNRRCDGLVPAQRLEPGELRSYHSQRAIGSELAWLQALRRDKAVTTPVPIKGKNGELIQIVDLEGLPSRHAVLFDWENGSEPSEAELLGPFEV